MPRALSVAAIALIAAASLAQAQPAPPPAGGRPPLPPTPLALPELPAKAKLTVTTPAFKNGEAMPIANTSYGANTFPGLDWTKGPAATKTYAIVFQDSDPPMAGPITILHWTLFNIAGSTTSLPAGMSGPPAGALQGANITGRASNYMGPRPPAGGPPHHYHFQVFALDTALALPEGATMAQLADAMKGHVLASGEVVGVYQGPPKPAS